MAGVSRFDDSSELDAFLKSDYGPRVDYLYANRRGEQVIHKKERHSNSSNGRGEQFLLQYYSIETQQLAVCNSCTQIIHSTDCERYWIRRLNQTTGILVDSRELIHSVLTFCM